MPYKYNGFVTFIVSIVSLCLILYSGVIIYKLQRVFTLKKYLHFTYSLGVGFISADPILIIISIIIMDSLL